jgi:hypothetical protein
MKILSGGIFERNEKKEENPEVSPVNRSLSELNTRFFSSFDRLPHRVNHINFNLYHDAKNSPVRYTDPDGRLLINNVDIAAFAKQTDNGNYQISIEISISHYDYNGEFV